MSKKTPRGKTRHSTFMLTAGAQVVHVGESTIRIAFTDDSGYVAIRKGKNLLELELLPITKGYEHIFTRTRTPDFVGMLAPEGLVLQCKRCNTLHTLFYNASEQAREEVPPACLAKYHKVIAENFVQSD